MTDMLAILDVLSAMTKTTRHGGRSGIFSQSNAKLSIGVSGHNSLNDDLIILVL